MRASTVLLAVVSTACFTDSSPGDGEGTDEGGTAMPSTGSASSPSDSSESAPGSVEATSSAEASSDGTSVGPAVCGNASVEAGEPCDDGNDDDLDGCTHSCLVGPTGFIIVASVSPPPLGVDPMVLHTDSCLDIDGALVLDVLSGWLGGPGSGDTWPTSLAATCRGIELTDEGDAIAIGTTEATSILADYGPPGGLGEWQLICPEGSLPVGIRGRVFDGAPPYLRSIAIECAEASVVLDDGPPHVEFSQPLSTAYTPSNGAGDDGISMCATDEIAIGIQGHVDPTLPAVRDLGPLCGRIELVLPD